MEVTNEKDSKKLIDMIKELVTTQTYISFTDAKEFGRTSRDKIEKKVDDLRNYVKIQAKNYGKNKEQVEEIVSKFEGILAEAESKYKTERNKFVQDKTTLETEELQAITDYDEKKNEFKSMPGYKEFAKKKSEISKLKKEGRTEEADKKREEFESFKKGLPERVQKLKADIQQDMKNGDIASAKSKMDRLESLQEQANLAIKDDELKGLKSKIKGVRQAIKQRETEMEECDKIYNETVDKINEQEEKALTKVEKQNVFQKLIARVYNRIGGAKRFAESVQKPLEQKLNDFKDKTLPEVIKKAEQVRDTGIDIGKKVISAPGKAVSSIVQSTNKIKNSIIDNAKEKLEKRIESNRQKIEEYNKNNPNKAIGEKENKDNSMEMGE